MHLSGQKVTGKNKQFTPIDFLRRAEKLTFQYSDNDMMLKNIRGSLARIEAVTYREPSTMQSLKTLEQTGMVSYFSEKLYEKEVEGSSQSASVQSRMLKRSQASQPQIRSTVKKSEDKKFRVTSNPRIQGINELRKLFSGVVQIKVEPNIRILTKGDETTHKEVFNFKRLNGSKSIMCTNCQHKFSVNDSRGNTERTNTDGRVSIQAKLRDSSKKMHPKLRRSSGSISESSHNDNNANSMTDKKKIGVIVKQSDKDKQSSSGMKRGSKEYTHFHGNLISIEKAKKKDKSEPRFDSLRDISKTAENYGDMNLDSWDDRPKDLGPRLRTNSGNEIKSMAKGDDYLQLTTSNFVSSPDTRKHPNLDSLGLSIDKNTAITPAFEGRGRNPGLPESRFKVESVKAQMIKDSHESIPQVNLLKQDESAVSDYWQITGDTEMRVAKHKEIYDRM